MRNRKTTLLIGIIVFIAVTLVRLFIANNIVVYFETDSTYDAALQFFKALNVYNGDWMGEYNNTALIKGCFFPVFLGILMKLKLNFALTVQIIWMVACIFTVYAIMPMMNKQYILQSIVYALLVFNPISTSAISAMTYRNTIYYILCLISIAALIGAALRYSSKGIVKYVLFAVAGCGLGLAMNTREDCQWIIIFMIVALIVYTFFVLGNKNLPVNKRVLTCFLSIAICAAFVVLPSIMVAYKNYTEYGVFLTDDYGSGNFAEAYGAMTRPYSETESEVTPIPEDVRMKLYELSPSFAELKPYLEDDPAITVWKMYGSGNDYRNGWISYALRDAAKNAGYYKTAAETENYWKRVADEINRACDTGLIPSRSMHRHTIASPLDAAPVDKLLKTTLKGFHFSYTYKYVTPFMDYFDADEAYKIKIEDILGSKINAAYKTEDGRYISDVDLNADVFHGLVIVNKVYSVISGILYIPFALAIIVFGAYVLLNLKKSMWAGLDGFVMLIVSFGLFMLTLLRAFMLAFVEITGYATLTSPAYMTSSFMLADLSMVFAGVTIVYLFNKYKSKKESAQKSGE